MSLTHVIPQGACSKLEQLHYKSLLEPIDEKIKDTCFSYALTLHKPESRDTILYVVPRIHISRLEYLYKSIMEDFKSNDASVIADLYSTGMGLPKDDRLSSWWRCFSNYVQPVQDDIHVTLDDLMRVMEAHINKAKRESWCGRYSYQQDLQKHFNRFARYTFRGDIDETIESAIELKNKTGWISKIPKDSKEGFIVYKFRDGKYRLYGSFIKSESHYKPFIRQVMDSTIPTSIKEEHLKDYGTFLIIPGYFSFAPSVEEIIVAPGTLSDVWDDCLEQDLFSHSDFKPEESSAIRKSKKFLEDYAEKTEAAKAYIKDNAKTTDRHIKRIVRKAKILIERYAEHDKAASEFKTVNRAWNKLNPSRHLTFAAYDIFLDAPVTGFKQIKTDYTNIISKLAQCGFNTLEVKSIRLRRSIQSSLTSKYLVRVANNLTKLDIHCLWFGGKHEKRKSKKSSKSKST